MLKHRHLLGDDEWLLVAGESRDRCRHRRATRRGIETVQVQRMLAAAEFTTRQCTLSPTVYVSRSVHGHDFPFNAKISRSPFDASAVSRTWS